MTDLLCTFSGKSGDILWSLPTAQRISHIFNQKVDFAIMPYYEKMLPLIESQPYIDRVFAYPDWLRTHSNHGDQPWQPPQHHEKGYRQVWHLGYRGHPGINAPEMPLMDFIAWQQGLKLVDPIPFIYSDSVIPSKGFVAYAFNEQYDQQKKEFLATLLAEMAGTVLGFVNLNDVDWLTAAGMLQNAFLFVGCRSANWVIAQGLGKEAITYEPHPARHAKGHLGKVFGCPYGRETPMPFGMPPVEAAKIAASVIKSRMEKNEYKVNKVAQ